MDAVLALLPADVVERCIAFALVFGRIGTFVLTMPGVGAMQIPPRVRLGAALSVSAVATPFEAAGPIQVAWLALLVSEIAAGLLFGLLLRSMLWVLQTVGALLAQATAILPPTTGALTPEPLPALGTLFLLTGIALVFASDLYLVFIDAIISSLALAPTGTLLNALLNPQSLLEHGSNLFWAAASLSFPFLSVSCAYYVCIGLINRALPQLMVTFIGAPVLTALAFVVLWLQSPEIIEMWRHHFEQLIMELKLLG